MSLQPERAKAQPDGVMAFMPFYFERFCWTTRGWPTEARWAYLILLCEQYTTGFLPADPKVLERLSPGTVEHWELIQPKIPICEDGYRRNDRCSEHREKSLGIANRRREAARIAALAKHGRMPYACETDASRRVSGSGSGSESGIESESDSESHSLNGGAVERVSVADETKAGRRTTIPQAALDALWEKFPRKVGKKRAMALLDKGIREIMADFEHEHSEDAVIYMGERIDEMARKHRTTDPQFIPHPATWLGQGRYLDPVETP
jgi:hypothetical protein